MPVTLLLIAFFALSFTGLIVAAVVLQRRRKELVLQREALQKQRGAAHIREIALAAQAHTGRADLAVTLLLLSCELLEEAVKLAPREPAVAASLQELRELIDSMDFDDRPAAPIPNPNSIGELTLASMQLVEAIRLLARLEVRGEMNFTELRTMQNDLRRVQKALDQRMRTRVELETPSVLISAIDTAPQLDRDPPPLRIGPTH